MGEERRSCAAAGVTEGARGTQGQAAEVALQGGPGFPERSGMERRRSCAPRGNGTLERPGAGRRSGMQRSREEARSGGRGQI